jgi:fructose-1,6-bisphosphatase/inositol monophosphatase family enzyme
VSKHDQFLDFAKELALEAGGIMKRYFRSEEIGSTWKEDSTPLTVADTTINSLVIERIKAKFPDHGILGEEESFEPERDMVWVVDPIDGTVPFSLGMPMSTFALALLDHEDGQPIVSVLYDPFLEELFYATKGGGAFVNGKKLKTSSETECKQNYFFISIGRIDLIKKLREEGANMLYLQSGCYFAARVAAGQVLAAVQNRPYAWDIATTALIVQEAGGIVSDAEGKKLRFDERVNSSVMAANKTVHAKILDMIKETQ